MEEEPRVALEDRGVAGLACLEMWDQQVKEEMGLKPGSEVIKSISLEEEEDRGSMEEDLVGLEEEELVLPVGIMPRMP
jgi:hypothetical protein